jgi:serine/threonine protein kinase
VQWDELQPETEGGEMRALGSGISSTIYAVRYKGQVVAAKVYDLPSQGPTKTLKFFFNEIDILSKTPPHDCIVKYFGAGVNYDIGKAFVVLELANRGSLSAFLTEYHGKTAKSKEVKRNKGREKDSKSELFALYGRAFLHTASGLQHLHEQGIIHRDLAITNVLVFENEKSELSFKIADFGLSQICWQSPLITIRGSMRNYAPEAIEQATKYVNASDVFMFGMLMYEVLEGKIPWEGQTTGAAIKQKMKGLRPAISAQNVQNFSTFVELMKQCWHQDSRQRPKAEDVVSALQEALIAEQPSTSSSSSKG